VIPAFGVVAAWTVLDLLFNVRYPDLQPPYWYLLPSIDATVMLAVVALLASRGRKLPRSAVIALALAVVFVRVFRIADGLVVRYFNRPIELGLDLPTSGEMVRLLRSTVSPPLLALGIAGALGFLAGCGALAAWSVRVAERSFASSRHRMVFAGLVAIAVACSAVAPSDRGRGLRWGAFGPSAVPRLVDETRRLWRLDAYRRGEIARVRANSDRIRRTPHGLEKLGRANVLLFFIESYGATVLDRPEHERLIAPVYQATGAALADHGFFVASSLIGSPTYAGRSWLAHETIATGVRTADRVTDAVVQELRPSTMARLFRDAGYRTVLVHPANTHPELPRWPYDFQRVYAAWDFDYRGPSFGFASMPDQYVVDFMHRREVATSPSGLFVEYALISSHAPWNQLPAFVEDWSALGDGSLFASQPTIRFPVGWTNLGAGGEAYLRSIAYDLRVLEEYVTRFVAGDTLVIILGDHQPVAEVTHASLSPAVPIHVMSRNRAHVDAFIARGYAHGMRPRASAAPPGMETFLPALLADFSR
jgi:hypothetical protein